MIQNNNRIAVTEFAHYLGRWIQLQYQINIIMYINNTRDISIVVFYNSENIISLPTICFGIGMWQSRVRITIWIETGIS